MCVDSFNLSVALLQLGALLLQLLLQIGNLGNVGLGGVLGGGQVLGDVGKFGLGGFECGVVGFGGGDLYKI